MSATGRSRLARCFRALAARDEAAFVPFLMAGDGGIDATEELALGMVESGADILEIGVPFSDPMADGPVLQRAAERALAAGTTLPLVLDLVGRLRRRTEIPIVLFGYANPFFHFGVEPLAAAMRAAGADALLCVDVPPDEADEIRAPLAREGLPMIFLLAPTSTPERIGRVLRSAGGFVYFVSVAGVTGQKKVDPAAIADLVGRIRTQTEVPVGIGFGISSAAEVAGVARISDAVIVGSRFSALIEEAGAVRAAAPTVLALAREMKDATRRAAAGGTPG